MGKATIIKIKDIAPPDFELPKLDTMKGKTIFIVGFNLDVSQFGDYVVINTNGQGDFVTTSAIVIKQLRKVAASLVRDKKKLGPDLMLESKVTVKKAKEGEYFILT